MRSSWRPAPNAQLAPHTTHLAETLSASELLGDAHRVAVELLRKECPQRSTILKRQKTRLEVRDETVGVPLELGGGDGGAEGG